MKGAADHFASEVSSWGGRLSPADHNSHGMHQMNENLASEGLAHLSLCESAFTTSACFMWMTTCHTNVVPNLSLALHSGDKLFFSMTCYYSRYSKR